MRTRPLLTLKWSRKAMTLVIAAAPFQWTLAGNASNAPASEFNAFVQQDGKTTLKGHRGAHRYRHRRQLYAPYFCFTSNSHCKLSWLSQ